MCGLEYQVDVRSNSRNCQKGIVCYCVSATTSINCVSLEPALEEPNLNEFLLE